MPTKTALVLSAGGLWGAYQIGAWKHLSRFCCPDLVIGASIGALNAWQIAGLAGAEELERIWLDEEMRDVIRLRGNPGLLRGGYFDPAPLREAAQRIFDSSRPQVEYWLQIVQLPRFPNPLFRTRLVPAAEVTPDHLAATCSIWLFYPNVWIDGHSYTDGGLFGKLPLWAAARLGATKIIAIDAMPKMKPWWVQATISTFHLFGPKARLPEDVHILAPSEPLGDAQSAMTWDRERLRRWIDLGFRDAERRFPNGFE